MQKGLVSLLCLMLAGCLSNPNGHLSAQTFTPIGLANSHHYEIPPAYAFNSTNWWSRFHDKQLDQLITIALVDSPNMYIAKARVEAANQAANEAGSTLWPNVDASGYLSRQRFSQFGLVPPPFNGKTFNIGQIGFNLNYELDFWGKNRNLLAAKLNEACAAAADAAEARLIISTAVATAYFQLQGSLARIHIAEQTYARRENLLTIITRRAKDGIESAIPVTTEVSEVAQAKLMMEQSRADVELAKHQLAVLIGKNPENTDFDATPMSLQTAIPVLPAALPAHLLASRPDVNAACLRASAAAHQINIAKARFFPDVNISAMFSYQSVLLGKLFQAQSQNNLIQGAFDLPIFDAGARRANLGIQYAEYDAAVQSYNQTLLNALKDAVDQQTILRSISAQRITQRKGLKAIEKSYHLTKLRFQHGVDDYVQVLQIEQLLFQQQNTQVNLKTQQLQSIVAMIKALGGNVNG